jgi:uncharacterized protein YdiU (UPF0061 family)
MDAHCHLLSLQVAERTALTVSMWQCVGFVHGVLNTDNMSILGVTIDYGPYGWMDKFDPFYTPNSECGRFYSLSDACVGVLDLCLSKLYP